MPTQRETNVNTWGKVIQFDKITIYLYLLCGSSGGFASMTKLIQRTNQQRLDRTLISVILFTHKMSLYHTLCEIHPVNKFHYAHNLGHHRLLGVQPE